MFPDYWMNELRSSVNIVDIIGEYVDLKKKSGRFWGLCPFHGEKTPSFSVNEEKQFYYCFGCHAGGDSIKFLRENQRMSYVDAITYLANRAGMNLPDTLNDEKMQREQEQRKRLLAINKDAARFYFDNLMSAPPEFSDYLKARQLSPKAVVEFGIGAAFGSGNGLYEHLRSKGHSDKDMLYVGLVSQKNERLYDYFRNRLIFPIIALNKSVIGFGGRAFGDVQPKYLNSRESIVFNKRNQLYGLNSSEIKNNTLILVEGYFDVISLHQSGVKNVVATLGTALTINQVRLIKRHASSVYIAYDGDQAGKNAALRAVDIIEAAKINSFVLSFEMGMDPDDYIKANGKDAFDILVKKAKSGIEFKINCLAEGFDISSQEGREGFAKEATKLVSQLSPIERERYFGLISDLSRFSTHALLDEVNENIDEKEPIERYRAKKKDALNQFDGVDKSRIVLEQTLLALSMESPVYAAIIMLSDIEFAIPAHANFLKILEEKPDVSNLDILELLDEGEAKYVLMALDMNIREDKEKLLERSISEMSRINAVEKLKHLQYKASLKDTNLDERREILEEIIKIRDFLDTDV